MSITLTQKERMLLEDQKTHEQICIKKYQQYSNQAQSPQLKQIFQANEQSEQTHLNSINQLLSGTVPQMAQQGGQQQQQAAQQNPQTAQQAQYQQQSMPQQGLKSDKDMCTDMLMTEKYVSGSYDTTIFEFNNTNVRDVLNHIQKEEQKHGEAISQFMVTNGLYTMQ